MSTIPSWRYSRAGRPLGAAQTARRGSALLAVTSDLLWGTSTYQEPAAETVATAEAIDLLSDYAATVTETAALVAAVAGRLDTAAAVAESASVSAALAALAGALAAVSETVSLGATTAGRVGAAAGVSEGLSLAALLSTLAALGLALSEDVPADGYIETTYSQVNNVDLSVEWEVSALLSAVRDVPVALSEAASLLDALAARLDAAAPLDETPALAELLAAGQGQNLALSETVTLAESLLSRLLDRLGTALRGLVTVQPRREVAVSQSRRELTMSTAVISANEQGQIDLKITEDGQPFSLSLVAVSVVVVHRQSGARDERAASVLDEAGGKVRVVYPPGTLAPGLYNLQAVLTPDGGQPMTWPRTGYLTLTVQASL